ncbi:3-methylitaconate isomerase [Moellerella wisconsensis]|nr:3-methylitaconate isomerase [Moellerella wisconsensis]
MKKIPCILMRGGTSKGVFLLADDLPQHIEQRDKEILALMGSGHDLQIDGIGGGSPQTSKVAIISRSTHPEADIDYFVCPSINYRKNCRYCAQLRQYLVCCRSICVRKRSYTYNRCHNHSTDPKCKYPNID